MSLPIFPAPPGKPQGARGEYRVHFYECDPEGVALLRSVANYMMDMAVINAGMLGVGMHDFLDKGWAWMLSRFTMRVEAYPRHGDCLDVDTWPTGSNKLYAFRDFSVSHPELGEIARAESAWVVVDIEKRGLVRIPEVISTFQPPAGQERQSKSKGKLPLPEQVDHERRIITRYGDMDLNQHVSSGVYMQWAIETAPMDIIRTLRPVMLDIQFRAESRFGDEMICRAQDVTQDKTRPEFVHSLVRVSDQVEVVRARSGWAKV